MHKVWSWLAVELGTRAGLVSAAALVLTGILGYGVTKLDAATDQASYLDADDDVSIENVEYQTLFGGHAMQSVLRMEEGVTLVDFLDPENLTELDRISEAMKEDQGVRAVVTPGTALAFIDTLFQTGPDGEPAAGATESLAGGALAYAAGVAGEGPEELREVPGSPEAEVRTEQSLTTLDRIDAVPEVERTLDDPEWREFLLYDNQGAVRKPLRPFFPNSETALVAVRLEGSSSIEDEGAAADHVTDVVDRSDLSGVTTTTVGAPTVLRDIDRSLRGGIISLGAVAVGVMVIILLTLFRVRWRLLPALVILIGVTWAFGLAGYIGIPLSLVAVAGLPVLLGVGIGCAVQMQARIEEEVVVAREGHPIQESARNLGPGLVVVTFDAVLAFAALKFARVPMIRELGNLLVVGIIAICLCSIVLPIAVLGRREHRSPTTRRDVRAGALGRLTVWLGGLPAWTAVPFAVASVLILVGGVAAEDELVVESDPVEWLDQSSDTIEELDRLEESTGSSSELGVFVRADDVFSQESVSFVHSLAGCALGTFPEGDEADEADTLFTRGWCDQNLLPEQTIELEGEEAPALLSASSIVTTMSDVIEMPGASPLAPRAEDVRAAWDVAPVDIQRFTAAEDGEAMNLTFRTGYSSLSDGEEVVRHLRAAATAGGVPEGTSMVPSGLAVVGVRLLENIESSRAQVTYLAIAFVGLFLAVRLRSIVRSLLSLVPVLVATGMASIVAWALGLELSPMAAVGGPVVVAIGTGLTSLILLRFVEERTRGFAPRQAIEVTASRAGRAFMVSGLTAITGVAVIATSSLPLLRDAGIIVAVTVVVALISALVILPPMLVWADQEGREWVSRRLVPEELLARSRGGRSATDVPPRPDPA